MNRLLGGALIAMSAGAVLSACGGSQLPIGAPKAIGREDALPFQKTFRYTGRKQSFRVPAGVKWITVVARGGAGGTTPGMRSGCPRGGRGGRVFATIPVTPHEKFVVFVGGEANGQNGGFNGGADGGTLFQDRGGGGGGASDVRVSPGRLPDRILVAGGGGGQGSDGREKWYGCGGGGGGSTGGLGGVGDGFGGATGGSGGSGGTQTEGGLGGAGGEGPFGRGFSGGNGSFGFGGTGGACGSSACGHVGGSGAGGGGGYYGGGGGGSGGAGDSYCCGGGGGGGGSSYIEPSAKNFRSWQGWKNGTSNGLIVFSWK